MASRKMIAAVIIVAAYAYAATRSDKTDEAKESVDDGISNLKQFVLSGGSTQ